ncbi:MAG: MBL fold metallo-hydrolase [Synergistaceae bacterium]|nr:MBL fold metallo-hydrolase [Synergistaceae bacterium]
MKLTMLGTGNALATECFNTCFILSSEAGNLMTDSGGGNMILHQLKHSGFTLNDIHDIFITHSHIDHLLGLIWVIRIAAQMMNRGDYAGDMNIYSHDDVIPLTYDMAGKLLLPYQYEFIGKRIHLHTMRHNDTLRVIGHDMTFFDIRSERTKQFGFVMDYGEGKRFAYTGDEPCKPSSYDYVRGCEWLMHEAFCLHSQAEIFRPYEKHHSTVKDACETAQKLGVQNLILTHTEDSDLERRKVNYSLEGRNYFGGNIFIPYDLEVMTL